MASKSMQFTVHPAMGGLDVATDATVLDPNFLVTADNIEFRQGGQRQKRSGTVQYAPTSSYAGSTGNIITNSTDPAIHGFVDSWVYSSFNPVQTIVVQAGNSLYRSTGNGLWAVQTAASSFAVSAYSQLTVMTPAQDKVVVSNGAMVPIAWNPATTGIETPTTGAGTYTGSTGYPIFEHSSFHLGRLVMGGLSTAPHQVIMSAAGNVFDSTGADSFTFNINTGDGDRIIGISKPFRQSLFFFKGPQWGSIWQLTGLTLTTFQLTPVTQGFAAQHHRNIITTDNDIFWISKTGVHSLHATLNYGNMESAFLSLPIQPLWADGTIDITDIKNSCGFWDAHHSIVGWIVKPTGGTRSWVLVYNYALSDPTPGGKKFWSIFKYPYPVTSADLVIQPVTPASRLVGDPNHWLGGSNGYMYLGDFDSLEDDGVAITNTVQTPIITRFPTDRGVIPETQEKQMQGVVTYFNFPLVGGANTCSMVVTVDGRQQNYSFLLSGGGDTLG